MTNLKTTCLMLKLNGPLIAASPGLIKWAERIKKFKKDSICTVSLKPIFGEQIKNEVTAVLRKNSQKTGLSKAEDRFCFMKGFSNKGK